MLSATRERASEVTWRIVVTVPAEKDLKSTKGDSIDLFFRVKARDVNGAMVYRNITGAIVTSQVRLAAEATSVQFAFTCTLADQTTTPGGVLIHASPTQTTGVVGDSSVYDVQIAFTAEDVRTVLAGTITWIPEVTR
jgi:hypothetical protein